MLYFEDFPVGDRRAFGPYRLSAEEVVAFAERYDPQPFHLDAAAARGGPFGALAASGWHTCGIVMRLMVDGFISKAAWLGSPGVSDIKWLKPALAESDIMAVSTILEARPSRSKPDRGLLTLGWEATTPEGDLLMTLSVIGIVRRREGEHR